MHHSETDLLHIEEIKNTSDMVDCMGGCARRQIKVHDHGMVALVDVMPRLVPAGETADYAIVQAARVSYGAGTKKTSEDRDLIRYLLRHRHTSPIEMVSVKLHMVLPIFVARQFVRHRTAKINEVSGRYSVVEDRFYRPDRDHVCQQSSSNKQGGEIPVGDDVYGRTLDYISHDGLAYEEYLKLVESGVSRETARIGLPLNLYTSWYWKIDLHNLLHFLSLRMEGHAQREARDYATAIFALIKPIAPVTIEAFIDYQFESVTLSRLEIAAIRSGHNLESSNKREQAEWRAKQIKLGLLTVLEGNS